MSRSPSRVSMLALFLPVLGLASCGLLKKGGAGDASADADTTAVDAAPTKVTASNDADLTHPADEATLDPPEDATIAGWSATAKTGPGTGTTVATLTKGTAVTKIATHEKFVLVMFDAPKDPSKKVAGWITTDAFTAHVYVAPKDGGAKASKDGGGLVTPVDAAAPLVVPTQPSAAVEIPTAPAGSVEVAPTNGVCPADFSLGRDQRCHKNCSSGPSVCKLARCSSNCGTSGPVCVTPLSACAH
jgi:hypothetical protein